MNDRFPMRLQRYLSRSGIGSRRRCESLIDRGVVSVNGVVVREKGRVVDKDDVVTVGGREVSPIPFRYFIVNKPRGIISVNRDSRGRRWVVDLVPNGRELGLFPVGRLDLDTTGLILLTNDGILANRIMHPRYGIRKEYRAMIRGRWTLEELKDRMEGNLALENGEVVEGMEVVDAVSEGDDTSVVITIHEGRKHVVRRSFASIGTRVIELERTAIGGLRFPELRTGEWKELDGGLIEELLLS